MKTSTFTCDQGDTFVVPGADAQPTKCPFCGSHTFTRVTEAEAATSPTLLEQPPIAGAVEATA